MLDTKSDAYIEGQNSFTSGYTLDDCPYQKGHSKRCAWLNGWLNKKYEKWDKIPDYEPKNKLPPGLLENRISKFYNDKNDNDDDDTTGGNLVLC